MSPLAATLIALPAQAATERPACPTPTKAEVKRSHDSKTDKPPRGAAAVKGGRVDHIPAGLTYGRVTGTTRKGVVVIIMAGTPLVPELAKIIKEIEL